MSKDFKYYKPMGFGVGVGNYLMDMKDGSIWIVDDWSTSGNYDICHLALFSDTKGVKSTKRRINIMDYLQTSEPRYVIIKQKMAMKLVYG